MVASTLPTELSASWTLGMFKAPLIQDSSLAIFYRNHRCINKHHGGFQDRADVGRCTRYINGVLKNTQAMSSAEKQYTESPGKKTKGEITLIHSENPGGY